MKKLQKKLYQIICSNKSTNIINILIFLSMTIGVCLLFMHIYVSGILKKTYPINPNAIIVSMIVLYQVLTGFKRIGEGKTKDGINIILFGIIILTISIMLGIFNTFLFV